MTKRTAVYSIIVLILLSTTMMMNGYFYNNMIKKSRVIMTKRLFMNNGDKVYVINTSTRGLGLEFCKQILKQSENSKVIALARSSSLSLKNLKDEYINRLNIVSIDLANPLSIEDASTNIKKLTDKVDVLLNVAGILGDGGVKTGPERSISKIDYDWMLKSFQINLFGHVMLTQNLFTLLKNSTNGSKVINISARVGSIQDNRLGGWYSYRMTKASLNMFTKTFSLESKRHKILCISLHPGTTDTDLSKPFQKNVASDKLFTPEFSVKCMLNVIENVKMDDTGGFFAYDGSKIEY